MLSDKEAIATVAVKSLETAKKFYEGTLGLTKVLENEEVLAFKTGKSTLFVYRSQYAGTNKATAATFVAEEVDDLVRTLKAEALHSSTTTAADDPARRCSRGRVDEGRLVQRSRRQYFQLGHALEHGRKASLDRLSSVNDLNRLRSSRALAPAADEVRLPRRLHRAGQPRRAASTAAMSIFVIDIIAWNARFASAPPAAMASVSARG